MNLVYIKRKTKTKLYKKGNFNGYLKNQVCKSFPEAKC